MQYTIQVQIFKFQLKRTFFTFEWKDADDWSNVDLIAKRYCMVRLMVSFYFVNLLNELNYFDILYSRFIQKIYKKAYQKCRISTLVEKATFTAV